MTTIQINGQDTRIDRATLYLTINREGLKVWCLWCLGHDRLFGHLALDHPVALQFRPSDVEIPKPQWRVDGERVLSGTAKLRSRGGGYFSEFEGLGPLEQHNTPIDTVTWVA